MKTLKAMIPSILILLVLVTPAVARQQTLISGKIESGGYGGPVLKLTEIDDELGLLVGGRGGWIVNHTFVIGGAGYGLATNVEAPHSWRRDQLLNFGYGGLFLEFVIASDNLVHLSVNTLIGAGGITYRDRDFDFYHDYHDDDPDTFFVAEPGVEIILNVAPNFRIGIGGSYRFIDDVDRAGLTDESLSGPSASMVFKIGAF